MRFFILAVLILSVFGVAQPVQATGCSEEDHYELGHKISTYQVTGQYICSHAAKIKGVDYWNCRFSASSPDLDVFKPGTYTYYSTDQKPKDNVPVQLTIEAYEAMKWSPCTDTGEDSTFKANGIFKKLIDGNIEMSAFDDLNETRDTVYTSNL